MPRHLPTLLLLTLLAAAPAAGQTALDRERAIFRAFDRGQYSRAVELIEEHLEQSPNDAVMLYNLACAQALLGERDQAASALLRSVKAGFVDFDLLREDPDLEAIRDHATYLAILEASERVVGQRAESALQHWRRSFGVESYRYETDEQRRLAYATALDARSHREMRQMLEVQADHLIETLFEAPPSYYVLIAVPTPEDARKVFGGDQQIGGIYEHARRRLIARDVGTSLRHEFVHLVHFGHMQRIGQEHPIWVQEGLATLYEEYELSRNGRIEFLPNQRQSIVQRRARGGRLMPWNQLFTLNSDRFMSRAGSLYPQVRSIFRFIAERGKLEAWYRSYVETFAQDPTGARAFEIVFDAPVEEVEEQWRQWVRSLPALDMSIEYGDAALGILSEPRGSNDGVLVAEVIRGSAAEAGRVHVGDVIVSIDGSRTRSYQELQALMAQKQVGDTVRVRVRRGGSYVTLLVTLKPLRF